MSIIFPGNYVAHLNAYREQGVEALPGVEFYRAVAALPLNPDVFVELVDGALPAAEYPVYVLSPDLRQDDKPRKDKALVIPQGSVVYKIAISAPGVKEETVDGSATIEVTGPAAPVVPTYTAEATGFFPEAGSMSALPSILNGAALGADTPVTIETDALLVPSLKYSAGACRNSPSAIIVEVCYYRPTPVPDTEDAHIPYAIEAGQGE